MADFSPGQLLWSLGILAAAAAGVYALSAVVLKIAEHIFRKRALELAHYILHRCKKPVYLAAVFFALASVIPVLPASPELIDLSRHVMSIGIIAVVAWLGIRVSALLEQYIVSQYDIEQKDNLRSRKIRTQFQILQRIIVVIIFIIAISSMLMTFEKVRQFGTSILASAGIAGIIIGFAAQRSIATLFAGLQIALTQPIRLDDVVIVENEWGRIEEITLTYVVVRIWDQRRLVLPITYFTEHAFQNWTRTTSDILGTVYVYVDYTIPVQEIREAFFSMLDASELWDKKVRVLQVTNATERTVELRALMSASDASTAWSLRCEMREKLIAYIQKHYPQSLPRVRALFEPDPGALPLIPEAPPARRA